MNGEMNQTTPFLEEKMRLKFLLFLFPIVLFLSSCAAPQLRFMNSDTSSQADYGAISFTITVDGAVFDVLNLKNGQATDYQAVEPGDLHEMSYSMDDGTGVVTEPLVLFLCIQDLKRGKTYTVDFAYDFVAIEDE